MAEAIPTTEALIAENDRPTEIEMKEENRLFVPLKPTQPSAERFSPRRMERQRPLTPEELKIRRAALELLEKLKETQANGD